MTAFNQDLRRTLGSHLAGFERHALPPDGSKTAAVALTVVPDADGQAALVVTRRASGLRRHSGQWALPGGRADAEESAPQTALRELEEEVALKLAPEDVLGMLDDYATRSGFVITPVVVWGRAGELRGDPREVASVHLLSLSELAEPENLVLHDIPESDRPVLSLAVLDTLIFAPTAAILHQFFEVAVAGRETRVDHYEQPLFAWK
jgi:8-oxo-dGTP pyrophosphatase MutT (NUDIX family)